MWWTNRFNIQELYILPTSYLFCIYLRTNSYLCHLCIKQIGFYNWDDKCLLHGPGTINVRPATLHLIRFYTSIRMGLYCKQQIKRKECYQQLSNCKWILTLSTAAQSSWKAKRAVFSVGILSMRVLMCFLFSSWDFVTSSFFSSFFFFSSP
jgi:hypothetical protein